MQTKKRAKSVKFGKKAAVSTVAIKKAIEEPKKLKEINPVEEDMGTAQEIKQKIEEKIHPKEEGDLPTEISLAEEEIAEPIELQKEEPEEIQPEEKKSEFGSFINEGINKPKKKGGNLAFFFVVVFTTFLVGLLAIGGFYYFSGSKKIPDLNLNFSTQPPSPTPSPTSVPTPTEKPIDLSAYSIRVLNGSGKTGEAAKVKSLLIEAGFTVDDVGNADASDYTKTVISTKNEVNKEYLKKLSEILSKSYSVDEKAEKLSDTNASDVIITIGSTEN